MSGGVGELNHQQAVDDYHQALTLVRTHGDAYDVAATLDNLGHPHTALGQHQQVPAVWREALQMYREQGRSADTGRVQRQLDTQSDTGDGLSDR